jgi:FixJ family two-component response regulator
MIAIVDDDEFVRGALEDLIASFGHRVRTYDSAVQFLASSEVAETSCLITDVQMPGMSGLDLQQHLLASGSNTPIIFLTAFPQERAKALALDRGALAFLHKPFNEPDLISCIDRALDLVDQQRVTQQQL